MRMPGLFTTEISKVLAVPRLRPNRSNSMLLLNGRIHPRADSSAVVAALLIEGGRVIWVGEPGELDIPYSNSGIVLDLGGRTVLPGLIDAHLHLEHYASRLSLLDCEQPSLADCLTRVRAQAERTEEGAWILGHGWDQNLWGGYPSAADLDQGSPIHPAYLTAKSLHAAWANSKALELARINASTPDPADGAIQRSADGSPTGILFEGAMRLISALIGRPAIGQRLESLARAQARLLSLGLTGVHDFDGPSCFEALQLLREAERLQLRVVKNLPAELLAELQAAGFRTGFGDEWIRLGHIKVFADGALGPRTASMLSPYSGEPGNRGMLLVDHEGLADIAIRAAQAGLATSVHAIGDQATHEVLGAFSTLREYEAANQLPHLRHRIEHLQLLHPDDSGRAGALNLVASMQPVHATSDMPMADRYWGDRVRTAYAWRTELQAGAHLAFGSDAPVEDPNPFLGIHAAVTRRRLDGSPGPQGWVPNQRVTLEQAMAAYTLGPAYAAGMESVQGRLEPGYLADLVVLARDPYACRPDELAGLAPVGTMVGGEWRYRDF